MPIVVWSRSNWYAGFKQLQAEKLDSFHRWRRPWISSAFGPGGYEYVTCGYPRFVTPICVPAAETPVASLVGPLGNTSKTCESFAEYRIRLPLPLHPPTYLPATHVGTRHAACQSGI